MNVGSAPQANRSVNVKMEVLRLSMAPVTQPPTATAMAVNPVGLPITDELKKKLLQVQNSGTALQYPVRETFGIGRQEVITNHFLLKINPKLPLYQYKITPALSGKSKRKIRLIIETAIAQCAFLDNNKAAFATDYFDTIISWTKLHELVDTQSHPLMVGDGDAGSRWYLVNIQDGPATHSLELSYEGEVDVQGLCGHMHLDLNHADDDLQPTLRALNILVSKSFDELPVETLRDGANKFFVKSAYRDLGTGNPRSPGFSNSLCTLRGYSYTVKPGAGSILLNVNAVTSAFWKPVLLSTVLDDYWTFRDWDWYSLQKALRGLRVCIMYKRGDPNDEETYKRLNSDQARVKSIEGFGLDFALQDFTTDEKKKIKVLDHFKKTYGKPIRYPLHGAVNLGSRQEPRWYPSEYLQLLPYQKFKGLVPEKFAGGMLETACQRPPEAKALIALEGIRAMGLPENAVGLPRTVPMPNCNVLGIIPNMVRVPSSTLGFPKLQYGNGTVDAKERWLIQNRDFLRRYYSAVNVLGICENHAAVKADMNTAFTKLKSYAGPPGGSFRNYCVANFKKIADGYIQPGDVQSMHRAFKMAETHRESIPFAMLFLRSKDSTTYAHFKDLADRVYGMHSICITKRCIGKNEGEKFSNIMLKINLKAAGTNHTTSGGQISAVMRNTLVLGADVTHPGANAVPGCPSIAAIVGSVDGNAGQFLGSMRLQNQARKEIIDHVRSMVKERILDWVQAQGGRLPTNIIYYRDGVSDAQFLEVKTTELPEIEKAFIDAVHSLRKEGSVDDNESMPTVNITALVCVKRHSVRFYPLPNNADRNLNCPPGTQVESIVTSPFFNDFYLQSHAAIKGTAKPCHYFVLRNDMNMSMHNMRTLTHELCYTYVRAPCAVSYSSPAYYADRLCERGRIYLRDLYHRTPAGTHIRRALDAFRHAEEDSRFKIRLATFGPLRTPRAALRRKNAAELHDERVHREQVVSACEAWVMSKARANFYGDENDVLGRNPWRQEVSKTMFWM